MRTSNSSGVVSSTGRAGDCGTGPEKSAKDDILLRFKLQKIYSKY